MDDGSVSFELTDKNPNKCVCVFVFYFQRIQSPIYSNCDSSEIEMNAQKNSVSFILLIFESNFSINLPS